MDSFRYCPPWNGDTGIEALSRLTTDKHYQLTAPVRPVQSSPVQSTPTASFVFVQAPTNQLVDHSHTHNSTHSQSHGKHTQRTAVAHGSVGWGFRLYWGHKTNPPGAKYEIFVLFFLGGRGLISKFHRCIYVSCGGAFRSRTSILLQFYVGRQERRFRFT
jgi:hypothetical protein